MKKIIFLLLAFSLSIGIIGCTKAPIDNKVVESKEIPSTDKIDVSNLTLLDEYLFDFDEDGEEERIAMYTAAEKDENGEIVWDDGQNWLFLVQDTDKDYVLFDDYVQLGNIDFYVYTLEDDFYIDTVQVGTANLTLKSYHYDKDKNSFIMTVPYNTTGNVNMMKRSNY